MPSLHFCATLSSPLTAHREQTVKVIIWYSFRHLKQILRRRIRIVESTCRLFNDGKMGIMHICESLVRQEEVYTAIT